MMEGDQKRNWLSGNGSTIQHGAHGYEKGKEKGQNGRIRKESKTNKQNKQIKRAA